MSRPTIHHTKTAVSPLPRRVAAWNWRWEIRNGDGGPLLTSGRALTRRGAFRQRERARARCQRRTYAHVRPVRKLTDAERESGLALINRLMPVVAAGVHAADNETLRHEAERLEAEPTSKVIKSMRLIVEAERAERAARAGAVSH